MKLPNQASKKFGAALRSVLRQAKVRQAELARHLELTPSAVSQMLTGKLMPSSRALEMTLEFVGAAVPQAKELYRLWRQCWMQRMLERSEFSSRLFALRCDRGLSVMQLSEASGIPLRRLRELHESFSAEPTGTEVRELASVLSCREGELNGVEALDSLGGVLTVADDPDLNRRSRSVSLLHLEQLKEFSGKQSLEWFAVQREVLTIPAEKVPVGTSVALLTDGSQVGLPTEGKLALMLGNERPAGFFPLDLVYCRDGSFRLCAEKLFLPLPAADEIKWQIPVLEMTLQPTGRQEKK